MGLGRSRLGGIFAAAYIFFVLLIFIFVYTFVKKQPAGSEFLGVYIFLFTLPWSIVGSALLDIMTVKVTVNIDMIMTAFSAVCNAVIFYYIGYKCERSQK
ncbi:MAG: SCO4225 family membrane protein [Thermodesulfovibrionales bacterium]